MKGVFVLLDGVGDKKCKVLSGKTPLEAAESPNLDSMAAQGRLGYMYPVHEGFVPGTADAIVSLFSQNWQAYPRGWLEAIGAGIDLDKGDIAFRANFATLDNMDDRNVVDRRVGRTLSTKEAKILARDLNKIFLPRKFLFEATLQHRGVLVLRGGFSENLTEMDPAHHSMKRSETGKFRFAVPTDDDENSLYTANLVNEFVEKAFHVLDKHPVNQARRKKGFYAANLILLRAPGVYIKKIKKYRRWACTSDVPVIKGISKCLGINLFDFSAIEFKGHDAYHNLKKNLALEIKKNIKMLKKNKNKFDYFLVYFKETDVAGHDNKPNEKKAMIELIDKKFFSFLKKFVDKEGARVTVTGDHSTPCEMKKHSSDPVPVLLYGGKDKNKVEKDGCSSFDEIQARKGALGHFCGKEFLKKTGFV